MPVSELDKGIVSSPTKNKYAWRLNCEDGAAYGIDPRDYETRETYHEAVSKAKGITQGSKGQNNVTQLHDSTNHEICANDVFVYCRVSRLDNGLNQYYILEGALPKIGDTITVPAGDGETKAIVLGIAEYSSEHAPIPPERTLRITVK